ncbi:MAG: hypothetical protein HPY59_08760 [Anaerolineae bacterium]|nr:hypothetical protein [Anaerolineae bacterium]
MRSLIRRFDAWISLRRGVFDFSQEERCILRAELRRARRDLNLPEISLKKGEPFIKFHLWNSHLPAMPESGPDLGWATETWQRFQFSLRLLARQIENDPALNSAKAICGVSSLFSLQGKDSGARLMRRLGFVVVENPSPLGAVGGFLENLYSWLLMWAYNPASLRSHTLPRLQRTALWMTTATLRERFGKSDLER